MAAKDPEIADLTILVLREIRDEVKKSNERLARLESSQEDTNVHLGSLERRFDSLEKATMDGFSGVRRELDQVNQRLEGLRDIAGEANRENRQRIDKLEVRVDRIESIQRG